jgi:hypothetical protein
MINCPTCEKFDGHDCAMFGRQPGMAICPYAVERKPRNNFELLKTMSMEQMAEFINGAESEGRAYGPKGKSAWLKWLKWQIAEAE